MSAAITSASVCVSSSLPISSVAVNNLSKVVTANAGKPYLPTQVLHQNTSDKLPIGVTATVISQSITMENVSSSAKATLSLPGSLSKPVIPSGAIITIAAPTRPSVLQPAKVAHGKHNLPVRPLPITSLSQITPRPVSTSTAATALNDPGGGFVNKPLATQPSFLSTSLAPVKTSKVTQHIFMAPGLNTPTSSLKVHQTFSPTFSYQMSGQPQTNASVPNSRPAATTQHNQPSLLVRPLSQPTRTFVPLAMTPGQESAGLAARTTNVLYQPTSTISISIPAKPNNQQNTSTAASANRITVASSQAIGKSLYQVGITQRTVSSSSVTPSASGAKPPRFITVPQTTPAASIASSRGVTMATTTSGTPLVGTAFTYSATPLRHPSVTTITTSAIPIAKIYPSHGKYPDLQPSVGVISAHVRTTEFLQPITAARPALSVAVTTTQSSVPVATVVTSLASSRVTSQPSSIMYWPTTLNNSSTMYTPPSYGATSIRAPLNSSTKNSTSLTDTQIRINQPGLFGLDTPNRAASNTNVAAFTQGQLLHTTSPSLTGKEQAQLLQPLLPTSVVSQHIPNSSPKPAILRRPVRADNNITKKLTFETRVVGQVSPLKADHRPHVGGVLDNSIVGPAAKRFSALDMVYPMNIKSELGGQVSFTKPLAASNGLPPLPKLQNSVLKDYHGSPFLPTSSLVEDMNISQLVKRIPQNLNDMKVKTEPGYHPLPFKNKPAAGHTPQQAIHSPYFPMNKHLDGGPRLLPNPASHHANHQSSNKHRQVQQRPGMLGSSAAPHRTSHPTATALNAISRLGSSNVAPRKDFKPEMNSFTPVSGVKRGHDKLSSYDAPTALEQGKGTLSGQDSQTGLSPRKKPRKQTHVVAEELPDADQPVDEEMSTDDADECEDEVPLISPPFPDATFSSASTKTNSLGTSTRKPLTLNRLSPAVAPSANVKSTTPPSPVEEDPPSEYIDKDGVRYVAVRERPPILLLNGHRARSVNNHFTHYADVKVKEKKTTLHDVSFNRRHLRGWKILQFAAEIEELSSLDSDILQRIEAIKKGLLEHSSSLPSNGGSSCEGGRSSPAHVMNNSSPGTPRVPSANPKQTGALSSFGKSFPSSCTGGSLHISSPLTPVEKKATRFQEEILKIEDIAQANIQRCNVMQEQLTEAKIVMVKILEQHGMASKIVEVGREAQKAGKSSSNGGRGSKKKKS